VITDKSTVMSGLSFAQKESSCNSHSKRRRILADVEKNQT